MAPKRNLVGEILWAPWSAVGWVATMGWMGLIAGVMLPVTLFLPFERFQARFFQPAVSWPLRMLFSPLRVFHDPHYDRTRVSVFMQNHVSMLDACAGCGSIPVPMCGLENEAHLRLPGYGWLLRMSNAIPVPRGEGRYAAVAAAFRERASRGISVLTFPEAHRTTDGKLRTYRSGVFRAAIEAGLPIVPVSVRGMYRLLPKGAVTMRPSRLEAYVAPQIETVGLTMDDLPALMERVRVVQEAWLERREQLGHLCREPLCSAPTGGDPGVTA